MNIKIQGGGAGKYANTGSSFGAMQYLNHENEKNLSQKGQIEPFFDHKGQGMDFYAAVDMLDQNKAKLCAKDAKFFAITISPSEKELSAMGNTEAERSQAMKVYTRQVMDNYAKNFGKGLRGEDLLYFAKIHHNREEKEGEQMHAHVIVSRKSANNKVRLSPLTNHRKKSGKINGFDRTGFIEVCEDGFDRKFKYQREYKDSFLYQNAIKNGTFQEKVNAVEQAEKTPVKPLLEEDAKHRKQLLESLDKVEKMAKELEKETKKGINDLLKKELFKEQITEKKEGQDKSIQEQRQEEKENQERSLEEQPKQRRNRGISR